MIKLCFLKETLLADEDDSCGGANTCDLELQRYVRENYSSFSLIVECCRVHFRLFQQCAAGRHVGRPQVRSAVSRYENTVRLTMIATPLLMARAADLSSPPSSVDHPAP